MPTVVAQGGEAAHRYAAEGRRGGVLAQDGDREFAVEGPHMAREFGKAEIDEAVQLPHAIAEVLEQPLAQPDELAQFLGEGIGQGRGGGPLLGREAGDAQGVDSVGLGASSSRRRSDGSAAG